jgi:hypothetical protein
MNTSIYQKKSRYIPEIYLHLIWKTKRLPFLDLMTTDGSPIELITPGIYNTSSGPDFFNGSFVLNNIRFNGNIELHVKSSDWFLHNHQLDRAYDSVALHVVYENDQDLIINGRKIPTIELKNHIDWEHFDTFATKPARNHVVCSSLFQLVNPVILQSQFDASLFTRMERKFKEASKLIQSLKDPKLALFCFCLNGFGMKIHSDQLMAFGAQFPYKIFQNATDIEQKCLLLGMAGFCNSLSQNEMLLFQFQVKKYELKPFLLSFWKTKGSRPQGSIYNRLIQFLSFYKHFRFDENESPQTSLSTWIRCFNENELKSISESTVHTMFLNSVFMFLGGFAHFFGNEEQKQQLIELLYQLKFERNSITKEWISLGVLPTSAYDSQACIELFNSFCVHKKCMQCKIGNYLLKKLSLNT